MNKTVEVTFQKTIIITVPENYEEEAIKKIASKRYNARKSKDRQFRPWSAININEISNSSMEDLEDKVICCGDGGV